MSVPASIARRDAIARAQAASRAQFLGWREEQSQAVRALLDTLADQLADRVTASAGSDGRVPPEALYALEEWLAGELTHLDQRWTSLLQAALATAVAQGVGVVASGAAAGSVVARVLAFLDAFVAADGLQLSHRLWRLRGRTRDTLLSVLRASIVRGADASRVAAELLAAGQAVPPSLAGALADADASRLGAALRRSLTGRGGAYFNAERLLLTEINRAYTEGFIGGLADVEGVAGVKFTLSPRHPRPDICDFHAAANLHGLGPGVYPLGQHPYPAHPMTLSYLQPVFVDEISDADRDGQETAFDWIRRQPIERREAVLGGRKKREAFDAGLLLPGELRWPWYAIAERLGIRE